MKVALSVMAVLLLAGCASYADLGGGRYAKTALSEERSPFGTNSGFAQLQDCKGEKKHWYSFMEYSDCQPINGWQLVTSQGQGGQVAAGALNAAGLGILGAVMPNPSPAANASQSVTVTAPRGHHR